MQLRIQSIFTSINATVTLIIVAMGLLGLAATLVTGQVYHSLTLRSQMENTLQLLQQEADNSLLRTKQYSLQFSTLVVHSDLFIKHITHQHQANIQQYLSSLEQSPFLLSGVLNVKQINVYDFDGKFLTASAFTNQVAKNNINTLCTEQHTNLVASPPHATEIRYDICSSDQSPYLTAILPFNIQQRQGWLKLIVELTPNLQQLQQSTSFPIRLRLHNQSIIFTSPHWPSVFDKSSMASYAIRANNGTPAFYIDAIHQDSSLDKALATAQKWVISGAGISISIMILLAILFMKKAVINPVNDVIRSIRMLSKDKSNIGAQVTSSGVNEIVQLAEDFNAMSNTLRHLYDTLETMAYTDALTRLGNRKLFYEKLEQVIDCAKNRDIKISLLMIDLNKFKQVNDSYGHQMGDQLLVEISNRFGHVLRTSDYLSNLITDDIASPVQDHLARLGGDEFGVILPKIQTEDDAVAVAKKLLKTINDPITIDSTKINIGLSIGIAIFPDHASTTAQLIHCADLSMYRAKKNNMGYCVFS